MRPTVALFGEFRKGFWFKNIWKTKSKFSVVEEKSPAGFKSLGIKPIDPFQELFPIQEKEVRFCLRI